LASLHVYLGDNPEKHLPWHEVLQAPSLFGEYLSGYHIRWMLLLLLYMRLVIANVELLELSHCFLLVLLVKWARWLGKAELGWACRPRVETLTSFVKTTSFSLVSIVLTGILIHCTLIIPVFFSILSLSCCLGLLSGDLFLQREKFAFQVTYGTLT
jgi:hypothetical protein